MANSSRIIAQCISVGRSPVSTIGDSDACSAAGYQWDALKGKCYTLATEVCGPLPRDPMWDACKKAQDMGLNGEACKGVTELFTLGWLISKFMGILFPFAGLILFGVLVLGGYKFLTSGGNEKQTQAAWAMITSALIGFFLLVVSYAVIATISFILGFDSPFAPK